MAIDRKDPFSGYNFAIELDGITGTGFKECSGLDRTQSASDYREGTDPTLSKRKIPGLVSWSNITLKRGLSTDHALWDWQQKAVSGKVDRRAISIILLDDTGAERMRWNVRAAWPVKWSGPAFDAGSDAIAIESLELAHEGIEVAKW
ncbi:phage tail protein [Nannocystis sp.]|uniref:phage tail protein n=1 Tax=Nannocystis sp. TaxID=1962667 RepID=UPI0024270571|nr:phage tail protein [Nannocystis sp.]MBK7825898.1 phage tail protein [Nannocystis sp.]MBK9755564.1 phage tail protein [Nannocystis sp.]